MDGVALVAPDDHLVAGQSARGAGRPEIGRAGLLARVEAEHGGHRACDYEHQAKKCDRLAARAGGHPGPGGFEQAVAITQIGENEDGS